MTHAPRALAAAALLSLAAPTAASADLLSMRAQVQSGGSTGLMARGEQRDHAFHDATAGFTYGALVGVEVLFVDAWVEHNQFIDGDGFLGTWTQFMAGLDLEFGLGDKKGVELDGSGGYSSGYGEFGLAIGFGVGTLQQVEPPLDNRQIDDKGFVAQATFGAGYRLSRLLSLGLAVPVQAGYLFKSGAANDVSNQYSSVHAAALLNLRMKIKLK
jgi:hypothetical protein